MGVDRAFCESALVVSEDPGGDGSLAEALAALGPDRVGLPISRIGSGESALPIAAFAESATILSADFVFDADSRIRSIAPFRNHPTVGDWLARRDGGPAGRPLALDCSIDPRSFPQYGVRDVAAGKIPVEALKGKIVAIGLMLDGQQAAIDAPICKRLPRTVALAIAAESARAASERPHLDLASRFAIILAFCFVLGLLISSVNAVTGFAAAVAASAGWLYAIGYVQPGIAAPLPAICCSRASPAVSRRSCGPTIWRRGPAATNTPCS